MSPDAQTVKHVDGAYARVLSKPGSDYAVYIDGNGPTKLILALPAGTYFGAWINPVTGQSQPVAAFTLPGGDMNLSTLTFENGIALRITRQ
jgi:hypothetical protein